MKAKMLDLGKRRKVRIETGHEMHLRSWGVQAKEGIHGHIHQKKSRHVTCVP